MRYPPEAAAIMAAQHSLITRSQSYDTGLSPGQIDRLVRAGMWQPVGHSVFRSTAAPFTWHTKVMAACLGGRAVTSHRTGAVQHGLDGFRRGRPEVIIPRGRHYRPRDVRVHEVRDFDLRNEVPINGIPTCGIDVVLFQLAGFAGLEATGAGIDQAIREKKVDWLDLYETLTLHARRGRKGSALFRAILDVRFGERVPDSRWNRQVADLLADAGLPRPTLEHEITDHLGRLVARVDLAWPRQKVAVELQSMKHHFTERAFHRDPLRRNELLRLGWIVLEYTWRFYVEDPAKLCDEVRATLATR